MPMPRTRGFRPPRGRAVSAGGVQFSPVLPHYIQLAGGLDLLTPTLELPPGALRDASNFECAPTGGYARIGGYERYDGRPKPSGASYALIQVDAFQNVPATGQTLTGATSGATGVIIEVGSNYVAVTKQTGTFQTAEVVKVGTTVIGNTVALTVTLTAKQQAQYAAAAMDQYRNDIGVVPGSGPIRGVVSAIFGGVDYDYAFRDNAGGTATLLYEASSSGWQLVTFYNEVSFTSGGTTAPAEGDTLTQGGNTATIKRVVLESGSWASGTAAGRFIVTTPSPGNFAAGAATDGAITVTLSGAQTAITLATGGTFEFVYANFSGSPATARLYGCDGVNRAFEFDGTIFVPISTKATPDTPSHITAHANHLVVAIQSSLLYSGPGLPYNFSAAGGGGEIAVGQTITGLMEQAGMQTTPALYATSQINTYILYGSGSADFSLVTLTAGVGAQPYTHQAMFDSYIMSAQGLVSIERTLAYGNFTQASLTYHLQPTINNLRDRIMCSVVNKTKSQYRIFGSDGSGLYCTIVSTPFMGASALPGFYQFMGASRFIGAIPVNLPDVFYRAWNQIRSNGDEVTFVGGKTSGYVYQLDSGPSADGANLDAHITLNWDALQSPRVLKRFLRAILELQGNFFAEFTVSAALGYSSGDALPLATQTVDTLAQAGTWDTGTWDTLSWDAQTTAPSQVRLSGRAENIQLTITSTGNYVQPYTVNSILLHYQMGRMMR